MNTSSGLHDLLVRNGLQPTGDAKKDIALARSFLPAKRNRSGKTTKSKNPDIIKPSNKQRDK
jgi:hypothetical protein